MYHDPVFVPITYRMAESDSGSITPTSGNYIACESITNKLTDVAKVAESLDAILKDLQNCLDIEEPCSSSEEKKSDRISNRNDGSSADVSNTTDNFNHQLTENNSMLKKEWNSSLKSTEDESFVTASDFRFTPQSTRSSYRTASEGGSPWWNNDKTSLDTSGSDMDPEVPSMQLLTGVVSSASVSFDDSEHSFLSAHRSPLSEQTDSDELTNKTKSYRSSLFKSPATSSQAYRDFHNASTSSKVSDESSILIPETSPWNRYCSKLIITKQSIKGCL